MALLDDVRAFLDDLQWPSAPTEDEESLLLRFDGKNGSFPVYVTTREALRQVLLYAVFPARVPEGRREALAVLLTRANRGMIIGNFEADLDVGEVRYKTSLDLEGVDSTPLLLRNVIRANVLTMDHYLPALRALAESASTPEEALALVESGESSS